MSIYNVHGGHNQIVPGARKYLDEVTENRIVKDKVLAYFHATGHTVYDCTDDVGRTQSANLSNIVKKCNAHKVDLDISIHLNAGGGTGVEVLYYSNTGKIFAERISAKAADVLGLENRGVKKRTNLYVLKHTKAAAVLVECCFVDSITDRDRWDADKCAKAIVEAITGKSVVNVDDTGVPFLVKIIVPDLTIRAGAGMNTKELNHITDRGTYTILEVRYNGSTPWGRLKSGAGWISLVEKYVKRI